MNRRRASHLSQLPIWVEKRENRAVEGLEESDGDDQEEDEGREERVD